MKVYRHNGERWYIDDRGIVRRFLNWFCRAPLGLDGPVWFFGERVIFLGWGIELRTKSGYWVLTWPGPNRDLWRLYHSRSATPGDADTWIFGAPREVIKDSQRPVGS